MVIGAGLMGAQIGAEYALGGHDVRLVTRSVNSGELALGRARDSIAYLADRGIVDSGKAAIAVARLSSYVALEEACAQAAIVVESVTEDATQKSDVLRRAAQSAPDAILASNTSSLSITDLGKAAAASERTIGTHYWNPPTLMPLVELIPGRSTAIEVITRMRETLTALGKIPVSVGDVPGFVWNRLQFALLREAAALVTAGVAEPETIDLIVRAGLARRWSLVGPFQTMALGGPRTFATVARLLFPHLSVRRDAVDLEAVRLRTDGLDDIRQLRDEGLLAALIDEPVTRRRQ